MSPSSLVSVALVGLSIFARVRGETFSITDAQYIFSFGDSYTASPSAASTLKNVTSTNSTSSGGETWVENLSSTLGISGSFYNFASPGASIANRIVHDYGATDFVGQVTEFNTHFRNSNTSVVDNAAGSNWSSSNSLFSMWFGVEDLGYVYASGANWPSTQPYLLTAFDQLLASLYSGGARNFLIVSIPPIELSPLAASLGEAAQRDLKVAVDFYNGRLIVYADLIPKIYPGSTATYFDTTPLFITMLSNPIKYGFQNSGNACPGYAAASNDTALNVASCQYPLAEYFWKDTYHPSFTVQKYIGSEILLLLKNNQTSIPMTQNGLPVTAFASNTGATKLSPLPATAKPAVVASSAGASTGSISTSNPTPTVSSFTPVSAGSALAPSMTLFVSLLLVLFA